MVDSVDTTGRGPATAPSGFIGCVERVGPEDLQQHVGNATHIAIGEILVAADLQHVVAPRSPAVASNSRRIGPGEIPAVDRYTEASQRQVAWIGLPHPEWKDVGRAMLWECRHQRVDGRASRQPSGQPRVMSSSPLDDAGARQPAGEPSARLRRATVRQRGVQLRKNPWLDALIVVGVRPRNRCAAHST